MQKPSEGKKKKKQKGTGQSNSRNQSSKPTSSQKKVQGSGAKIDYLKRLAEKLGVIFRGYMIKLASGLHPRLVQHLGIGCKIQIKLRFTICRNFSGASIRERAILKPVVTITSFRSLNLVSLLTAPALSIL